jgi:sugar phosphate isomerase/epimerase
MKSGFPFRLGSTSYVIPADILPNVCRLGPLVDDVELVLFEVDEGSNLPSPAVIKGLAELAQRHDLTYTVHLPLDLRLAAAEDVWRHPSMEKARRVVRSTRALKPWAYVVHLDGTEIQAGAPAGAVGRWRDRAARSLEALGAEAGELALLAVENLESYQPEAFLPLLDQLPISLCLDVGHFFRTGTDPFPYLEQHLGRTRVVHLHGSRDGRDHRGLDLVPDDTLGRLLELLLYRRFSGVLTLEVFTERHFYPGRERILSWLKARQ